MKSQFVIVYELMELIRNLLKGINPRLPISSSAHLKPVRVAL